ARVRVLPPKALLARLDRRLPLLTGGPEDQPARLRTMGGAIAWSHDLLPPVARMLFRRLAGGAGGFTLEAAEAVCEGTGNGEQGTGGDDSRAPVPRSLTPVPSVLDALTVLVDHSLVQPEHGTDGEARFGMLEVIREYALSQLAECGEDATARSAHAAFF